MTLVAGFGSAEELRVMLQFPGLLNLSSPDFREITVELSSSDPVASDYHEARIALALHPRVEPDDPSKVPGKTACHHCGRHDPPGGLTHADYRPVSVAETVHPETLEHTRTLHAGPAYRDPAG